MVQSTAISVPAWLEARDPAIRPVFDTFRQLCRAELPGWEERMQWGMPGYGPPGKDNAVSFNDQKRHIALYAGPTAIERFAERLGGLDCGKGCIRYRRPTDIDFPVVTAILRDIFARAGTMG